MVTSLQNKVEIIALTEDRLDDLVEVFLSAFKEEATTASWLDLSCARQKKYYKSIVEIKFKLYLEAGNPIFTAMENSLLTGFVVLKKPEIKTSPGRAIRLILPRIHHAFGLVPYFFQVLRRGMADATRVPDSIPENHLTLEAIAVDPEHQGKKIGRLLIEHLHHYAKENCAAPGIYLMTGDEKNRLIYERLGYTLVETRDTKGFISYHMFRENSPG